jgi:glucoamylase
VKAAIDSISAYCDGPSEPRSKEIALKSRAKGNAPGGPGLEPRWTRGAKVAVGTAYSTSSRVWYTLDSGCVTEVYYPTIDTPQIRDLQFLVTDGQTFFHDERRNLFGQIDCISETALGFEVTNCEKEGRYTLHKTIIGDPHQNCLLLHTSIEAPPQLLSNLRIYVLCAPHLEIGGWHNDGRVVRVGNHRFLAAHKGNTWLVIGATVPFTEMSCGYVGVNDGWTDLADNYLLDWQYDAALDGNIALTGGLDLSRGNEFTVGLAFGTTQHDALTTVGQSLSIPFERVREMFTQQWERTSKRFSLSPNSNKSTLFRRSVNLLLAHEDKTYPGALIASLSIPWSSEKSDDELGGYHLVWTRDLVKSVTALLAVGDVGTPLRSLIYLAVAQREDGGFCQNFWIDGRPYWRGVQLDQVAFPVLLAWRLWKQDALGNFDPYDMVRRACRYLIREGPVTAQDRWEESSGYSPSTLAAHIAGLICAAEFLADRGEHSTAEFVRDYADFLESHIERWTVTTRGTPPAWTIWWALNWSGLPVVHVRPTVFLEGFFLLFTSDSVKELSQIKLPFGEGKTSPVTAEDVARVVAALLTDPLPHIGKIYHLTGPQSENMKFFAREYSKALGRTITYQDIPVEPWKDALLARGMPAHLVHHLATMADLHRAGRYDRMSDDVLALTGQAPMSVQEFVSRNVAAFTASVKAA